MTAKFAQEAEFVARAAGMPDAPWLLLPYPVAGTGAVVQRALAQSLVPRLVDTLRGPQ